MEIQLKLRNYEKWRVGFTNLNTFGNLMIPENVKNISNVGKYDKIGGKYGGGEWSENPNLRSDVSNKILN